MNERKKEIIVSVYATLLISFKLHGKHFNVLLKNGALCRLENILTTTKCFSPFDFFLSKNVCI